MEFNKCDSFIGLHIAIRIRVQKKLYMICVYIDTVGGGCISYLSRYHSHTHDEISFPNERVKKLQREKMENENYLQRHFYFTHLHTHSVLSDHQISF